MTIKIPALISVIVFFLMAFSAFAQDTLKAATPSVKAIAMASRFERELSLSKPQLEQVTAILLERSASIEKSTSPKSTAIGSANVVAKQKLSSVLTAKQLALYDELRIDLRKQKEAYLKKNPSYKPTDAEQELDF